MKQVGVNYKLVGHFCGCPYNKSPTIFGVHIIGPVKHVGAFRIHHPMYLKTGSYGRYLVVCLRVASEAGGGLQNYQSHSQNFL